MRPSSSGRLRSSHKGTRPSGVVRNTRREQPTCRRALPVSVGCGAGWAGYAPPAGSLAAAAGRRRAQRRRRSRTRTPVTGPPHAQRAKVNARHPQALFKKRMAPKVARFRELIDMLAPMHRSSQGAAPVTDSVHQTYWVRRSHNRGRHLLTFAPVVNTRLMTAGADNREFLQFSLKKLAWRLPKAYRDCRWRG